MAHKYKRPHTDTHKHERNHSEIPIHRPTYAQTHAHTTNMKTQCCTDERTKTNDLYICDILLLAHQPGRCHARRFHFECFSFFFSSRYAFLSLSVVHIAAELHVFANELHACTVQLWEPQQGTPNHTTSTALRTYYAAELHD